MRQLGFQANVTFIYCQTIYFILTIVYLYIKQHLKQTENSFTSNKAALYNEIVKIRIILITLFMISVGCLGNYCNAGNYYYNWADFTRQNIFDCELKFSSCCETVIQFSRYPCNQPNFLTPVRWFCDVIGCPPGPNLSNCINGCVEGIQRSWATN